MELSPPGRKPAHSQALQSQNPERELHRRAAEVKTQTQELERQAQIEQERVRAAHSDAEVAETERHQSTLQNEKSKGYEEIRKLQQAQSAELNRIRREGEAELQKLREYYRTSNHTSRAQGEEQLQQLRQQLAQSADHGRKTTAHQIEEIQSRDSHRIQMLQEENQSRIAAVSEAARAEHERMSVGTSEALEREEASFRERFQSTRQNQKNLLDRLNSRAAEGIREIREETAQKLSAYSERQNDPFYKLVELDASMRDEGDHLVLSAKIPEHEQKHISVSIKGDQLVVSGYRRNEEKLEMEGGKIKSTASYQSFHESFPLPTAVESKRLTREFEGDRLVVKVPKKREYQIAQPAASSKPERAKVEKPHFPENIPLKSEEGAASSGARSKGSRGTRTLT